MSATNVLSRTEVIRELNDNFRQSFVGGAVMVSAGVEALDADTKKRLLEKVRQFDTFTEDNDPHQEHDFGAIEMEGQRFLWKIDYYDRKVRYGSEDPANPDKTTRVLTVMRSAEY